MSRTEKDDMKEKIISNEVVTMAGCLNTVEGEYDFTEELQLVKMLDEMHPASFFYVHNLLTNSYLYASKSSFLIEDNQSGSYSALEYFKSLHPNDVTYYLTVVDTVTSYISSCPLEEQSELVFVYYIRKQTPMGYVHTEERLRLMKTPDGMPLKIFIGIINKIDQGVFFPPKVYDCRTRKETLLEIPAEVRDEKMGSMPQLTEKEKELIRSLAKTENFSLSKVADTMEISVNTVKFHAKNIKTKLGMKDYAAIVQSCYVWGIL